MEIVRRLALFAVMACLVVYLRPIPMGAIPEAFQDRVEHAMPHWLNSSMHLLKGLPALNTTVFNGNGRRGVPSPGALAKAAGRKPHHPVVIVPGFISSGLELWEGLDCGRHFFRQRMWGTPAMARAYFSNRECWMQHMRLDPKTGLDPQGIKLRAVTGLEAVDWFVPGYFVWGKVIESLGEVGYDPNSIHAATFDWRLSPEQLETRDGYFTRLKHSVETLVEIHDVKVALLAHSYGDQLVRYFLNWVETSKDEGGGGGGSDWTSRNVAVYVDIAGPMLGIPKAIPSLLSGEMRDTALLGQLESVLGLGQNPLGGLVAGTLGMVASTFRTWGSLWSMLPRGGVDIWGAGDELGAPDDVVSLGYGETNETILNESVPKKNTKEPLRHFISLREQSEEEERNDANDDESVYAAEANDSGIEGMDDVLTNAENCPSETKKSMNRDLEKNMTVIDSLQLLFERVGEDHPQNFLEYRDVMLGVTDSARRSVRKKSESLSLGKLFESFFGSPRSFSFSKKASVSGVEDAASEAAAIPSSLRFGDPLTSPLPRAPDLKIFCMYGVGKPTERAYRYVRRHSNGERPYALDVQFSSAASGVFRGVSSTDGDGSIPLVSLGYVCAEAWRDNSRVSQSGKNAGDGNGTAASGPRSVFASRLNPSGASVTIREYHHRALGVWGGGIQEGPGSGDHVNIMGNHDMIRDVIEAVTGHGGEMEERVFSDVFELARNVERLREKRSRKEQKRDEL
jgi:phospholipid:diacylglycerol acyltransferase